VDKQRQSNDGNNNNKSPSQKATQTCELYNNGKKAVEVAIELGLSEKEVTRYYTEYWRFLKYISVSGKYLAATRFIKAASFKGDGGLLVIINADNAGMYSAFLDLSKTFLNLG
jgi:hypothetical protein